MLNAVINSTPIIALHSISKLDLLGKIYGEVYIPYAVYEEISVDGDSKISKDLLLSFPFFSIKKASNEEAKRYFKTALHKGEVETMILADEIKADLCILDDKLARDYAKFLGLKVTGTLGVLVKAKEKGFIDKVVPLVDALIQNQIYISGGLYEKIRRITGE